MISGMMRAAVVALALGAAGAAVAQDTTNRVAVNEAWSVFEAANPRECWIAVGEKSWTAERDGRDVTNDVNRGDIRLFVLFNPENGSNGQVVFTGGYPFEDESTVKMEISGREFVLYAKGENAWPSNAEADAQIVAAMRAGSEAVLTARSARGTVTKDSFSLLGFTASLEEAQRRCAG